jgi:hypothetical protein
MKTKLYLFICSSIICLNLFITYTLSYQEDSVYFNSEEQGIIISYFDNFYIVNINGTMTVSNPSQHEIYAISMNLFFASLRINIHNNTNKVHAYGSSIIIPQISANSSVSFDYSLYGITSNKEVISKEGVLTSALKKKLNEISSQMVGNLYKAPLEDTTKGGRANTRLVSAKFFNPSSIPYIIRDGEIIKTPPGDMNLYNEIERWSFDKKNITLKKNQQYDFDVLDTNAYEGEIYWLNTDMYLTNIKFNSSVNISIITQDDLFEIIENRTNATINVSQEIKQLTDRVYLQKKISKSHINPGDEIEVVLLMNNFGSKSIEKAKLIDEIPNGFEIVKESNMIIDGKEITWNDLIINSQEVKRISYKLKYIDNESIGMDYFVMAKLFYEGKEVVSNNVPFVRIYLPEKKLFVQKEINFKNDDNVEVIIKLNNLGENSIDNIVLNEFLKDESEFKEISREFIKKGLWDIKNIKSGDTWEVSYTTNQLGVLNTFPVVYGIPEKNVMKTVILSNLITTEFKNSSITTISLIGVMIVLILSILMFLPTNFFNFKKRKELNTLKITKKEIEALKLRTGLVTEQNTNKDIENKEKNKSEKKTDTKMDKKDTTNPKVTNINEAIESLNKNKEQFDKIEEKLDMRKKEL